MPIAVHTGCISIMVSLAARVFMATDGKLKRRTGRKPAPLSPVLLRPDSQLLVLRSIKHDFSVRSLLKPFFANGSNCRNLLQRNPVPEYCSNSRLLNSQNLSFLYFKIACQRLRSFPVDKGKNPVLIFSQFDSIACFF